MKKLLTVIIFTIINTGLLLSEQETPVVTKALRDSIGLHVKMASRYSTNARTMDFRQARAHVRRFLFLSDSLQAPDANLLVAAADVEDLFFNAERNNPALGKKMDEAACLAAAKQAYLYYYQAYRMFETDAERYRKSDLKQQKRLQQMAMQYYLLTKGFHVNAMQSFQKKLLPQALDEFRISLDGSYCNMLHEAYAADRKRYSDYEEYLTDSVRCRTLYNCATISSALDSLDVALAYYDSLKVRKYESDRIYRQVLAIHALRQDTTSMLRELKQATRDLPLETWYKKNLLQIYLDRQQWNDAEGVAQACMLADSTDAVTMCILGQLREMHGHEDEALSCYLRSYALDSTQVNVSSFIGRIHYNRAVKIKNELYNARKFKQIDAEVQPVFDLALPWYLRAYELDTTRQDSSIPSALREILYSRFTKTRCPNRAELIAKYNEISKAYGLREF